MSIGKALGRVGIVLSVAVMAAIGQTKSVESVKIGNLTWTKQNLNIETADSWCYLEDKEYCAKYGRLYTYEAAKTACASMGGGWRLPDTADWRNLVNYAGGGGVAGKKLKSKSGWDNNGNGTDDYGFSALPGGSLEYGGRFYSVGRYGVWWSATEGRYGAYYRSMHSGNDNVYELTYLKSNGFSVRCAKN